jgi:DNA-binding protein H-NS
MDLTKLTGKQLDEIVAAAGRRKTELLAETKTNARARIEKILADEGLTLDELFGRRRGAAAKGARAKVAPKYRNPKDSSQTWSGRGRTPLWLAAAVKAGKKIQDFAIDGGKPAKAGAPNRAAAKKAAPAKKPAAKKS